MPNSISEEPINRFPSNLGGSAHQSQLFYMPNSSSEKPSHQHLSNLGRSAHQPDQLSEPESEPKICVQPNVNPSLQPNKDSMPRELRDGSSDESESSHFQSAGDELRDGSSDELESSQPQFAGDELRDGRSYVSESSQSQSDGSSHTSKLSRVPSADLTERSSIFVIADGGVPGGSAHHPQLTETQIEDIRIKRRLHIAAQRGDWKSAKSLIDNDPNVLTVQITNSGKTLLHVAASCWQWGFVLKLLERTSPESCVAKIKTGNTVLHLVAQGGSLKTAKALVQKNASLLQMFNDKGEVPLYTSISRDSKELIWYLSLLTRVDSPTFNRSHLLVILRRLIESGHQDIALYFVRRYPYLDLAIAKGKKGDSLLYWLATNPSHFFSGSNLGFFERLICKFVHVDIKNSPTHLTIEMEDINESILEGFRPLQPRSFATQALRWFKRLIWKTIAQLAPSIKMVRDAKLKHECGVELVNHVCTQLCSMNFQDIEDFLTKKKHIMAIAVTGGIEEIVRILLLHFPDLIDVSWYCTNILQAAIEYRQENIFNIIKETYPSQTKNLSTYKVGSGNTTLHLAGMLAPAFKLFSVSGAALQMQRELQWFKEVENITFSYQREKKNKYKQTAKDVFRTRHKELAEQGEKWMRDTANSCMIVSTLIATVLFAAAFTVPGGNINDKGIPIFLRTNVFTVFAISNALGLFSSLTSLLMFLAILTARYEIDDFLKSLPTKLIIGLGSLFIAIASMIIAFGATLTIVLSERWNRVFVPITLLASFPLAMFVMLQLPLFIQMVRSTYGASIFRPWPSRKFERL